VVTKLAVAPGVFLWRERFSPIEQKSLLDEVRTRLQQAPLYRPVMPGNGKAFSVEESNFGKLGWCLTKTAIAINPSIR
jgi:alkylated DNA repair protein (DNA oxidative demethylase)